MAGTDEHRQLLVSHLLRRAGFGAAPAELDQYASLGYSGAVERLLNYDQVPDSYPDYTPTAVDSKGRPKLEELQLWWLNRMLTTSRIVQDWLGGDPAPVVGGSFPGLSMFKR